MPKPKALKDFEFSLHGKLSLALCLAIGVMMAVHSFGNYQRTRNDYERDTLQSLSRLQATFQTILERSNHELFRYADQYTQTDLQYFQNQALPPPSMLSSIESVFYFSSRGETLGVSKLEDSDFTPDPRRIHWAVNSIKLNPLPVATLDCLDRCFQSVYIPVITDSGQELIVNINRSATLLLQDFHTITNTDLILMTPVLTSGEANLQLRANTVNRSSAVKSNTLREQLLDKIHNAVNEGDFLHRENAVHQFIGPVGSGFFGLRIFHVNDGNLDLPLIAVVVENADNIRQRSELALKTTIQGSSATILISLLLIFFLLRPPLKRLKKLTEVLRLLPERQYAEAGKELYALNRKTLFRDEIVTLRDTVDQVNLSLESLNDSVEQHRVALRSKISDLSQANDFTNALLDNSPLLTIIHEPGGRITNINAMGRQLTGIDVRGGEYRDINQILRSPDDKLTISEFLAQAFSSRQKAVQTEIPVKTAAGNSLDFLWIHSSLNFNDKRLYLSSGMDITERREAAESLNWLGQHDRVTGLLNRTTFIEKGSEFIHRHREHAPIRLLMLDIDDLASFNDRFGFETGDKLLNSLAEHFASTLPTGTLLARTGSGEFCALLQDHDLQSQAPNALTRYQILTDMGREEVCLSGVIDDYHADIGEIDEWLSNTTVVLSRVKQRARGSLYHATADDIDNNTRREKYRIKEQLIDALENNRLTLFFQPILSLADNRVSHCECLVRMLDNDGQFLSPAKFLDVAAEYNLLPRLDYAVIEMAMRQQNEWQMRGITTGLSINMTAPTMEQPDFHERITTLLRETGANPQRLIFEVVETDGLENIATARQLLANFKNIGAKIAFDDFGVGFTSFEYVRELPVDYIKIDQSFIRFIQDREEDQQLVKSMIEMSHSLGKKVIAEGIETREALTLLRDLGAEYLQGYFISRPLPIDAVNLELRISDKILHGTFS